MPEEILGDDSLSSSSSSSSSVIEPVDIKPKTELENLNDTRTFLMGLIETLESIRLVDISAISVRLEQTNLKIRQEKRKKDNL